MRSDGKILTLPAHPGVRLVLPVAVLLLCLCGVLVYVIDQARHANLERAGQTATSLISAISSDISRNIEILDLSLQGVDDDLKYPDLENIDPEWRRRILFDRSATARHLGRMMVIDEAETCESTPGRCLQIVSTLQIEIISRRTRPATISETISAGRIVPEFQGSGLSRSAGVCPIPTALSGVWLWLACGSRFSRSCSRMLRSGRTER